MAEEQGSSAQTTPGASEVIAAAPVVETTPAAAAVGAKPVETKEVKTEVAAPAEATQKAGEEKPVEVVAPEKYELKIPEKSLMLEAQLSEIEAQAKAFGLSNEKAQALVDSQSKAITDYANKQQADFDHQSAVKWPEEIKADKEIGGENFKQNIELAHRAFVKFAPPEFSAMLEKTGLANHPGMVKTFARIAKEMGEDTMHIPNSQNGAGTISAADRLYPPKGAQ